MKKNTILAIILVMLTVQAIGQRNGKVSGFLSNNAKAIENASITLLKAKDSVLVKAAVSDKNGGFIFENINYGTYLVVVNNIGFQRYLSPVITLSADKPDITLGTISIEPTVNSLGEVTVTSRKPFLEMKADKMVVNVDASPSNAGSTALEVLEKSPGVTVDKDGNISLKGKQGVTILVDGRPTYMASEDLANMLRGMNANQLDQIEIMTNPPARFDASGNSGVINIRTKKIKTKGFNGNINTTYGQGVYPKAGIGTNLNYRINKLNIFGNYNYSYREAYQQFSILRNFINPSTKNITGTFDQRAYMPDSRNTHSGKIGIDYTFSKRTSAALTLNGFGTKMEYNNKSTSLLTDGNGILQSTTYGNTLMTPNVTNYSSNFNLRHQFDSTGKEISFDADYISYKDKHRQRFINSIYNAGGTIIGKADSLFGDLPSGFDVYAAKLDYVQPLKNKGRFEAGGKLSFVTSDNNMKFDSIINGNRVPDITRSNYFIYKEHVYAAYISLNTPLNNKLSLQAGLRYEYTDARGDQVTSNIQFKNSYGQFFPTLYLSYNLNDKNMFSVNAGRRIMRPQYRNLNPFVFIVDRYTYQKGNPYLQPQFSNNVELSHTYAGMLTTTLNYSATSGVISEVIEQNETTKETFLIRKNIASLKQYGLAVNFYKSVTKWMTLSFNANLFNNRYKGIVNDTLINLSVNSGNFNAAIQTKLGKGWDAELNGFYNTRGVDGVMVYKSMGMFSFAVSKTVLKNQGKITLNYRDPFKLQRFYGTTRYATVDATINSRWENSILNLTFNYRFGKSFKTNKRSSGSASEEASRMGG
jgi:iron complex outermembrane receptor protein